jgi:hypothetical protein
MYRDDPLADEEELRAVVGDTAVDALAGRRGDGPGTSAVEVAVDVLRVLQGWVDDDAAAAWFASGQRRLDGLSPVAALAAGRAEDVRTAAQRWAAAQG